MEQLVEQIKEIENQWKQGLITEGEALTRVLVKYTAAHVMWAYKIERRGPTIVD